MAVCTNECITMCNVCNYISSALAAAATCPPIHCRRPSRALVSSSRSHKATYMMRGSTHGLWVVSQSNSSDSTYTSPLLSFSPSRSPCPYLSVSLTLASKSSGVQSVNFSRSAFHFATASASPVSAVHMEGSMYRCVQRADGCVTTVVA